MKRLNSILAAFAFLAVAACAAPSPVPSPVPENALQKVVAAEVAYEAVLVVAVQYNRLPRCEAPAPATICSKQAVVDELRKANRAVQSALQAAENVAKTPGVSDSAVTAALAAVTNATTAVRSIIAAYNVK